MQPIRVFYTPGHTPGSVCFLFGDTIFTGDTLLYQHIGRIDTPGGKTDHLLLSVINLLSELPGNTIIFPGHGQSWIVKEAQTWWQEAIKEPPHYDRFGRI